EAASLGTELHLPPEEMLKLRNEAIACLALVDLRLDKKWEAYPPGTAITGIAFDRNMQRFARCDTNGNITVRRLADNQELTTITNVGAPPDAQRQPGWRMSLRFSQDGQLLAASGHRQNGGAALQVWDLTQSNCILQAAAQMWESTAFDFSADSRLFAAGQPDGTLAFYNLPA